MRRRNLTVPRQTARTRRLRLSARLAERARGGRRRLGASLPAPAHRPVRGLSSSKRSPWSAHPSTSLPDFCVICPRSMSGWLGTSCPVSSANSRRATAKTHRSIRPARLTASCRARLLRRVPRPTAANATGGSALAARVLASRSPARVVPGPRDLLTRVAHPSQDGPAHCSWA